MKTFNFKTYHRIHKNLWIVYIIGIINTIFLGNWIIQAEERSIQLGTGESKLYIYTLNGSAVGYLNYKIEKKENNLYFIKSFTYLKFNSSNTVLLQERLTLLNDLRPLEYYLEIDPPNPIKSLNLNINYTSELAIITYELADENKVFFKKKTLKIPSKEIFIQDNNLLDHIIFILKKCDYKTKTSQEFCVLCPQSGKFHKLNIKTIRNETIRIEDNQYDTYLLHIYNKEKILFHVWVESKNHELVCFLNKDLNFKGKIYHK